MKVAIFGATGFLGSHIAEQMHLAGHQVVAFHRESSDVHWLNQQGIQTLAVDLNKQAALEKHLRGFAIVCNCLASPKLHQAEQNQRAVDIELTRRVVAAAGVAQVERFLQLSTEKVYGCKTSKVNVDEATPCHPTYRFNRIAIEREQVVRETAEKYALPFALLRASNAIGARDKQFLPSILPGHQRGFFVAIGNGRNYFSCMDARDVGRAMVWLAEQVSLADGAYVVKGYDISWRDLKETLDAHFQRQTRLIRLPIGLMKLLARFLEKVVPYSNDLPMTPLAVDTLSQTSLLDDSYIRKQGFSSQYTLQDGLKDYLSSV